MTYTSKVNSGMLDKCIFWCISYYLIFHRHGGLRHPPLLPWLVNSKILEIIPDNSFNLLLHSDSYHRLTPSLASHVYENNIQTTQYFLFLKDNTILFQNHISATTWHKYHEGIALRLITRNVPYRGQASQPTGQTQGCYIQTFLITTSLHSKL